jgi:hypothetical protein
MSVVVATAFAMSGLAIATPLSIRHFAHALSAEETARFIEASRDTGIFLAYLGGVTLWRQVGKASAFCGPGGTRNRCEAFSAWD